MTGNSSEYERMGKRMSGLQQAASLLGNVSLAAVPLLPGGTSKLLKKLPKSVPDMGDAIRVRKQGNAIPGAKKVPSKKLKLPDDLAHDNRLMGNTGANTRGIEQPKTLPNRGPKSSGLTKDVVELDSVTNLPMQISGPKKVGSAFRTRQEAEKAGEHVLEAIIKDKRGNTIARWFEASEKGSDFFGHTEQKALNRINPKPGTSITFLGNYPPCSFGHGCMNAMDIMAREMEVDISYRSGFGILEFVAGEGHVPQVYTW